MRFNTYIDNRPNGFVNVPDSTPYAVTVAALPDSAKLYLVRVSMYLANAAVAFDVSPWFNSEADAIAELDRIAALIGGTAPAQGWVEGPPPKDGKWYAIIDREGDPAIVRYDPAANDVTPWQTATHFRYANDPIHHMPAPIEAPKES